MRVFIEPNDNFRLPADPDVPVIMIGAGTGIAPFRAFMQQRKMTVPPVKLAFLRQSAFYRGFSVSDRMAALCP